MRQQLNASVDGCLVTHGSHNIDARLLLRSVDLRALSVLRIAPPGMNLHDGAYEPGDRSQLSPSLGSY